MRVSVILSYRDTDPSVHSDTTPRSSAEHTRIKSRWPPAVTHVDERARGEDCTFPNRKSYDAFEHGSLRLSGVQ